MRLSCRQLQRLRIGAWCAVIVVLAGGCAYATLAAILAIPCDLSPDPQRFCAWWRHSTLPTVLGMPAVLAFGCYASLTERRRWPITIAGVLIALTCVGLLQAAGPDLP